MDLNKLKSGDTETISEFVKNYYDDIYLYVIKLVLNKDENIMAIIISMQKPFQTSKKHLQ